MRAVENDVVDQRILEEVGKRTKRELRGLPQDHPALHHSTCGTVLADVNCQMASS